MRVEEYMTSPVVVASPRDSLARVRNLMIRYRVGRIVVIDEAGHPVGIITKTDLARVVSANPHKSIDTIRAEEAMTPKPITLKPRSGIRDAAKIMLEKNIGGIPIVDEDDRLVGIITKTDLVKAYTRKRSSGETVKDYMYTDVPQVSPNHSVNYVIELIESTPTRRVLVVDGGRLVGIIAPSDLAFASNILTYAKHSKRYRRFVETEHKGKLAPFYEYLISVASDVMTPDPITVEPSTQLSQAAILMINNRISSIPVVEEERPLGLVTKHSILHALLGK